MTVEACPECDSTHLYTRSTTNDYRCRTCGHEFETPIRREPECPNPTGSSTRVRILLELEGEIR